MPAPLAFLIVGIGIIGLFYLDRDKSVKPSKALWLPVIWLWLVGSRPASMWLGMSGPSSGDILNSTLEGSPMDAAIFQVLIIAGVIVLARRGKRTTALLRAIGPVLIYFAYCLISTSWSPYPESSLKRWIKCVGDLVMVLVLITDAHPVDALRRLFSRVSFILLPVSIVLIKCTNLGVEYDETGPHYTGVTTNKNTFGLMLYVVSIGVAWNLHTLIFNKKAPNRTRRLIAQSTVLVFGMALLHFAQSATSVFCFALGSGLMFATGLPVIRKQPNRVHILCLCILLLGAAGMVFGGQSVTSSMGKTSDFSGRTEIWAASIASADSVLFGTGFESFWNANAHKVAALLSSYQNISNLNSAHDGYLQIYLDLGWIGLILLLSILVSGYLRAVKAFRRNREFGRLILAFIITCAFYNISEAGFRIMTTSWISLLLGVIGASGVIIGLVKTEEKKATPARVPIGGKVAPAFRDHLSAANVPRTAGHRARLT